MCPLVVALTCPDLPQQVYEHLVFAGHEHVSIRALPGMADRTVRIGSAGKTFSLTAWKVRAVRFAAAAHSLLETYVVPVGLSCSP